MIKPELYKRTVDILVEAYFNDTLEHDWPCWCAVGNLVEKTGGFHGDNRYPSWINCFVTDSNDGSQTIKPEAYRGGAKQEIDQTGYKWQELAKIEYAFETAPKGSSDEDWMFNGLMAVIDVLDEIHQNTDTETTNATKQRFICQH